MFNAEQFKTGFDKQVKALAKAEKLTRETLRDMSRDLLSMVQATEDITYVNRVVAVLTPMNQKTAVLFFREYSGFKYNEEEKVFGKKEKKHEEITAKALAALDDPHFNMWTWAEKNLDVAKKPFKLEDITKFAERAVKKAAEEGIDQAAVLDAFFKGGFTPEAIVAVMSKMTEVAE
jgi:hypothetical protein